MLTGESTPIIKSHLPNIKQNFDEETDNKYFLFAGTKIVQKRTENKKNQFLDLFTMDVPQSCLAI